MDGYAASCSMGIFIETLKIYKAGLACRMHLCLRSKLFSMVPLHAHQDFFADHNKQEASAAHRQDEGRCDTVPRQNTTSKPSL